MSGDERRAAYVVSRRRTLTRPLARACAGMPQWSRQNRRADIPFLALKRLLNHKTQDVTGKHYTVIGVDD